MDRAQVLTWLALVFFAGASFFFAMAESALFSLGRWRAQRLAESAPEGGGNLVQLLEKPQDLLATIVLGNTAANAGILGLALWTSLKGQWPIGWAMAGAFLLILVGCEVIPKTLAVRAAERWSLRLVRPVLLLRTITGPFRRVAQWLDSFLLKATVRISVRPQTALTDEEYHDLLELAFQQGALGQSEKEIILQIIRLDQRTVKEVMKPRAHMICVSDELSVEAMVEEARKFRVRRLPLYDETPDTIVGILNVRTLLLDPARELDNAVEFPSFVPETMNLLQLLKSFQKQKRGLAIVLDEFGGTAGLVTMEHILEEIIGRLESDTAAPGLILERLGEGRWRVSGALEVADFRREYPELGDVADADTMAGLLVHELGVVPAIGEAVTFRGLRLTAHAGDERRVRELLVEVVRKKK